jgi:hypothetical protein
LIDDLHNELVEAGILAAIEAHDTPKLFDWIVPAFSYQGIADAIASDYMDRHGVLTWAVITGILHRLGAGHVALGGQQRSMAGQHLHVAQRASCAMYKACSLGDERPPAGVG